MLTLWEDGEKTMEIEGRWLYPLFLLYCAGPERGRALFSRNHPVGVADPRIGRGAVFLYKAIGIASADGEIVSDFAWETAEALHVALTRQERVPTLACATEELLQEVTDVDEAITVLLARLSEDFYRDLGKFVSFRVLSETKAAGTVRRFMGNEVV